ncbi:MAG: FadR family transcriptional regulator, partial [Eubacterium sp.]|nr:FadR family transcriptional regulator [Eubacterium sp.]
MEKSYEKVVQHVKDEILNGKLHPGDKLATERVLAEQLAVSRNSVREGLRILENIGVITSQQGSGNYISLNFDETMSEVLSFMYFLKGMDERQVT